MKQNHSPRAILERRTCSRPYLEMEFGCRFLLSCLWICLMVFRATHTRGYDLDGNSELLFAPGQLIVRCPAVFCLWRENSHLHPLTHRRQPFAVPNCYWLILLAGDVEINPGPIRYPCTAQLRRHRDTLPVITKKNVYSTLILPSLDYFCVVWQKCRKLLQQRVERIQNYAMRLICAKPPRTRREVLRRKLN